MDKNSKAEAYILWDKLRQKDASSAGHEMRVAEYTEQFLKVEGYPKEIITEGYYAALLHDTGKLSIPNEILKSNKRYDNDSMEKKILNGHSEAGIQYLTPALLNFQMIKDAMIHHHTSYNKRIPSGHPSDKYGKNIPEIARIIAVADVFDALSKARSYKDEIKLEDVYIKLRSDLRLDASIVEKFIPIIHEYLTNKQKIEENQAQLEVFEYNTSNGIKEYHISDNNMRTIVKNNIDVFIKSPNKEEYFINTPDEQALIQWNTVVKSILKNMPILKDNDGTKYGPLPIYDKEGKLYKIEYVSENKGITIGNYNIEKEDFDNIVKSIINNQNKINVYDNDINEQEKDDNEENNNEPLVDEGNEHEP